MKIVYVVHNYVNSGGTERVLAQKANYLTNKGFDIYIITIENQQQEPFFHFDPSIKIITIDISKEDNKIDAFLEKLTEHLLEIKPDITISTEIGITKYLYKINDQSKKILEYHFSKYKRKSLFVSLDKYYLGRLISDVYNYNKNNIAKQYDRFILLTEEDREQWRGLSNIEVIPNPITFTPSKQSDLSAKRAIAIGRFTHQKGFEYLIKIWANIHKKHPDWILTIIGEGKKKTIMETLITELGLSDVIKILPPTKDIESELLNSSIYLMTSMYEGLPLVLIEAMACGLPAVSFACKCGPKDVIKDGEDGFIIDFKDSNSFENKTCQLIEDEELRKQMGEAASKNIKRFEENKIMEKWLDLFKQFQVLS